MSRVDDYASEMPRMPLLDERTIEAILAGDAGDEHASLTAMVADMRRAASGPVPPPSPALSELFVHGFSTGVGTVPATVTNAVTEPATAAGSPKWRAMQKKVKTYVAGLSIAGKLALGVGVAAAATTGAGSAGLLPPSLQHDFAASVGTFVPFDVPDPGTSGPTLGAGASGGATAGVNAETEPSTTTAPKTTVPPSTTVKPEPPSTTAPPTTVRTEPSTTSASSEPAPSTTNHENSVATTLALQCAQNPAAVSVTCSWTVSVVTETLQYVLLRVGPDGNRVVMTTTDLSTHSFVDVHVDAGKTYRYMLLATAAFNTTLGHSNSVEVTVISV